MLDADQMLTLAQTALRACPADAAEVAVQVDTTALTRFANNQIHQNVASETIEVRARAVVGQRVGCASARGLDDQALLRVAQQAAAAARLAQARPDLPALPAPAPLPVVDGYVAATAECTPEERAALVSVVCERARARGLVAAGAAQTQVHALAVVNTRGVAAYACAASADLHAVVMAGEPTISGYAARAAADVRTLDATALAEEAIGRAERAHAPADLPEGDYEVVLEPYATADIVEMLAYLGFSARAYQEGTSFLCGRLGQQIVSEHVSIWDDALDPHGLPFPCDYEGVPKRRVALIERGVAHDVVYDTETGARAGRASTGHALPAPSTFGPMPLHLFMGTGDVASVEQFVAGVDRGVLVTRFWYTRPVHPRQVIVTGMTRDGTFRIEQGRVVGPVRNARYTQSYLAALSDVRGITRDAALLKGDMFGAHNVPALHLARWHFQVAT
ncbi:MAG: TldD/PmbA family protein [Chloroflexi bacterium]|nr:TldD/PmbA family protein [Chloroflexota bacterium]